MFSWEGETDLHDIEQKAIRFMALREKILKEQNYIDKLKREGKPREHRELIKRRLESALNG